MNPAMPGPELLCVLKAADPFRSLGGFREVFVFNVYSSEGKAMMMHWQTHGEVLSKVL